MSEGFNTNFMIEMGALKVSKTILTQNFEICAVFRCKMVQRKLKLMSCASLRRCVVGIV